MSVVTRKFFACFLLYATIYEYVLIFFPLDGSIRYTYILLRNRSADRIVFSEEGRNTIEEAIGFIKGFCSSVCLSVWKTKQLLFVSYYRCC